MIRKVRWLVSLLVVALANAQEHVAVVLLWKEPVALEAERLVAATKSALGADGEKAGWKIDGGRAVLPWAGGRFLIVADDGKLDGARDAPAHGGSWQLTLDSGRADGAPAAGADALLGKLAAALMDERVVALGTRIEAPFTSVDRLLSERLRDDGVKATLIEPQQSSLVVLLTAPRQLEAAALRRAVKQAFGVEIQTDADPERGDAVAADGATGAIRIGADTCLLEVVDRTAMKPAGFDVRRRRIIEQHKAYLRLRTIGPAGDTGSRARHQRLGRLAAAMWAEDCLALNWSVDRQLVAASEQLVEQLRSEDPVRATIDGDAESVIDQFDEDAMAKATAEARRTWPEAMELRGKGAKVFAKFPFATRSGPLEFLWIEVTGADGDVVKGKLGNDPVDVPDVKLGSAVQCKLGELSDWLCEHGGKRHGGFTLEVLEKGRKVK